ncbi:hypothetical protein GCM10027063_32990 [Promicromonospora xylanilytica]
MPVAGLTIRTGQQPSVTRALPHTELERHVREAVLIEAARAAREHVHAYTNCCERTTPSRAWGKAQPRALAVAGHDVGDAGSGVRKG